MKTDEQIVKEKWPDAYWAGVQGSFRIWSTRSKRKKQPPECLGTGVTLADAWSDAARRIQEGE